MRAQILRPGALLVPGAIRSELHTAALEQADFQGWMETWPSPAKASVAPQALRGSLQSPPTCLPWETRVRP